MRIEDIFLLVFREYPIFPALYILDPTTLLHSRWAVLDFTELYECQPKRFVIFTYYKVGSELKFHRYQLCQSSSLNN